MDPETARKIEFVAVEDIRPYENNPRNNSGAVAKVAESIREFGFGNPLLLDRERVIIAGHTRFEAAKRLGMERVPCIVLAHLTEAQANALRLADNKTQELSTWDYDKLTAEIAKLDGSGIDVRLFGFDVGGEQSATEALSDVGGKSIYYEPKEQPALKLAQCFDTSVYDAKIAALKELREGGVYLIAISMRYASSRTASCGSTSRPSRTTTPSTRRTRNARRSNACAACSWTEAWKGSSRMICFGFCGRESRSRPRRGWLRRWTRHLLRSSSRATTARTTARRSTTCGSSATTCRSSTS